MQNARATLPVTDRAFLDLMLYGWSNSGMMLDSLNSRNRYLLERDAVNIVLKLISEGQRVIVIHSGHGKRKDILARGLTYSRTRTVLSSVSS